MIKYSNLQTSRTTTTTFEENYDLHPGYNINKGNNHHDSHPIGVSISTSNLLPPVMSARMSPLPPSPIPQDLPKTPPPRKSSKDLAPLRVPQIKSPGMCGSHNEINIHKLTLYFFYFQLISI